MKSSESEPNGRDALARQRFLDIIAPLEEPTDGFDPNPRPLDVTLNESDELPPGHIALQGDFKTPKEGEEEPEAS
jgi:hypothetical protein